MRQGISSCLWGVCSIPSHKTSSHPWSPCLERLGTTHHMGFPVREEVMFISGVIVWV
jgi:hypothetical protein